MYRYFIISTLLFSIFTPGQRALGAPLATSSKTRHPFIPYRPALPSSADTRPTASGRLKNGRLARVTAYWVGEGDYYTRKKISATGNRLHRGVCAVDPRIIPYGSRVVIAGVGEFVAEDTGSAVISRAAARCSGRTLEEREALVIDLFFERAIEARRFLASGPSFAAVRWYTPLSLLASNRLNANLVENDYDSSP